MKKSDLLQWILSLGALITGYSITFHSPCSSGSVGVFMLFVMSSLLFSPLINRYIPGIKSNSTVVTVQITAAVLFYIFALIVTYPHCRGIQLPLFNENARISYWEGRGSAEHDDNSGSEDRVGYIEDNSEEDNSAENDSTQIDTVSDSEVSPERTGSSEESVQERGSGNITGVDRTASGGSVLERIAYTGNAVRPTERGNISSGTQKGKSSDVAGYSSGRENTDRESRETGRISAGKYAASDRRASGATAQRTALNNENRQIAKGSRDSGTTSRIFPKQTRVLKWPDGSTYTGELQGGKRNGTGTMKWSTVSGERASAAGGAAASLMNQWVYDRQGSAASAVVLYTGIWKDDNPFRKGTFRWNNNDFYQGAFTNMKRHGFGIYHYGHGTKYRGYWHNDRAQGNGTIVWKNGDTYTGGWNNDRREGAGTYVWSRGISYKGNWHNDMMHGNGVIQWKNGNRYSGQWKNNHREGKGFYTWKSGDKYEGDFSNDRRNGFGVYQWSEGKEYKGQWKNGLMDGVGVLKYPDGKIIKGTFRKNYYAGK
ncbi:MAG TPA: hypothetical protein PK200_00080 [Spirochaetota bacterium]|nr:hypothetical protein [Spirochaetota bacterium]